VPASDWLRGPLAATLSEQVRAGALFEEGWFDRDAVRALVSEHHAGLRDRSAVLWPLMALGLWFDRFRSGS
jgi:hypothetical protein